jgi:hypothetical protein
MNKFAAIQEAFGDVKPVTNAELNAVTSSRHTPALMSEAKNEPFWVDGAVQILEERGVKFGCGRECWPNCTC